MGCLKLTYQPEYSPLYISKGVNRAENIAQGFISTDPLKDDYPYYSSYQYAGNKPINNIDLDGLEPNPETDTGGQGESKVKSDNSNAASIQAEIDSKAAFIESSIAKQKEKDRPKSAEEILQALSNAPKRDTGTIELPVGNINRQGTFTDFDKAAQLGVEIAGAIEGVYALTKLPALFKSIKSYFKNADEVLGTAEDVKKTLDDAPVINDGLNIKAPKKNIGGRTSELLSELVTNGVKHNPDDIVGIRQSVSGKIVFLENGNSKAGLEHIMRHADDFAKNGIAQDDIAELVLKAVTEGNIVGHQGKGTGRPIYEIFFKGNMKRVAATVGDNGFIVGANPVSIK